MESKRKGRLPKKSSISGVMTRSRSRRTSESKLEKKDEWKDGPGSSIYFQEIEQGIAQGKEKGISDRCVYEVVFSHDQALENYVWLWPKFGRLLWVEFREPSVNRGAWTHYSRLWWSRHGCVVDHHPDRLVDDHVTTFVDPKTRIIELRFWFQRPSGSVYSMAPTREFYELEAAYFRQHGLCSDRSPSKRKTRSAVTCHKK